MAFGDIDSSASLKTAINSSNAFSGIVMPTNNWQLEILQMPLTTTSNDIENLFAKYGDIEKIGIFYKMKEKSVNCYLSFEKASNSEEALKENGKKVGVNAITVIKFVNIEDKGNKRQRTDDDGGWGSAPTSNGWGSSDTGSTSAWGSTPANSPSTRGGRGGATAGRGGGRACFKCGEEGHMSRECPKGGGGGGGRGCFKCGEEGHMSRECPKGGGRGCFRCGEEGHMSRDCPKGGGKGCFNCGEEGHMSRDCSKPRRGRGGGANMGNRTSNATNDSWGNSGATASSTTVSGGWD